MSAHHSADDDLSNICPVEYQLNESDFSNWQEKGRSAFLIDCYCNRMHALGPYTITLLLAYGIGAVTATVALTLNVLGKRYAFGMKVSA